MNVSMVNDVNQKTFNYPALIPVVASILRVIFLFNRTLGFFAYFSWCAPFVITCHSGNALEIRNCNTMIIVCAIIILFLIPTGLADFMFSKYLPKKLYLNRDDQQKKSPGDYSCYKPNIQSATLLLLIVSSIALLAPAGVVATMSILILALPKQVLLRQ